MMQLLFYKLVVESTGPGVLVKPTANNQRPRAKEGHGRQAHHL